MLGGSQRVLVVGRAPPICEQITHEVEARESVTDPGSKLLA
jgi:hypothetical protein